MVQVQLTMKAAIIICILAITQSFSNLNGLYSHHLPPFLTSPQFDLHSQSTEISNVVSDEHITSQKAFPILSA